MAQPNGVKPGERRGGRAKGTPNLDPARRTMREILASLNHDAIRALVLQAQDDETEPALRAKINMGFLDFLYPKLRSIEVKADDTAGQSDFLQVRELLAHYRQWKREQGLPLAGELPDKPPTTPYVSPPEWDAFHAELSAQPQPTAPATPARAVQTNGAARPAQQLGNGQGRREI